MARSLEFCRCGIPKRDHATLDLLDLEAVSIEEASDKVLRLKKKVLHMSEVYGNVCLDYKRDNLRYLEEVANNG